MSVKAVLADLYEEVTGDHRKFWPPEWMILRIVESRGENSGEAQLALQLADEMHNVDWDALAEAEEAGAQPIWIEVYRTDSSRLRIDITQQYDPELDLFEETTWDEQPRGEHGFEVHTVLLERYKIWPQTAFPHDLFRLEWHGHGEPVARRRSTDVLVPFKYDPETWKGSPEDREPWFDIQGAASSAGLDVNELVEWLCGDDPRELAGAYEILADAHGRDNFDHTPIQFDDEDQLIRWLDHRMGTPFDRYEHDGEEEEVEENPGFAAAVNPGFIRTAQDERDWARAKDHYAKGAKHPEGAWESRDWATVTNIYKRIKAKRRRSSH